MIVFTKKSWKIILPFQSCCRITLNGGLCCQMKTMNFPQLHSPQGRLACCTIGQASGLHIKLGRQAAH